jgi:hypothetical protein
MATYTWYAVTWLQRSDTWHPTMGRFRPNETKALQLPKRLADGLATAPADWRVETTRPPRGADNGDRRASSPKDVGPPGPEAHLFIDLSLSLLGPTMSRAEPLPSKSITVLVSLAEPRKPQIRAARRDLTRHLDAVLGELFRAHEKDFKEWARRNGVTLKFRQYYGLNVGGAPRGRRARTERPEASRIRELRRQGKSNQEIFHTLRPGQPFREADRKWIERI